MMKYAPYLLITSIFFAGFGCSVDTFQCDDCEDPFTADNCVDQHSQFHEGVILNLGSGNTSMFEIEEIDPFNELYVMGSKLYSIGDSKVLISSEFGNYVFDAVDQIASKIEGSDLPIVSFYGAQNLYFANQRIGDIVINDSTIIDDFISRSTLFKSTAQSVEPDTLTVFESRFIHPDTLLIPKIFFPVEIPNLGGIVALIEDEIHFVSVSSTTNRIFTLFEYKLRTWKHLDSSGEVIRNLSNPRKVIDESDPEHPSFSIDPIIVSHQEGDEVIISNLENSSVKIIQETYFPQISLDGEYVSTINSEIIQVYSVETDEIISISESNDYGPNNPTVFSNSVNAILYAEKTNLSTTLDNAVIKRASISTNGPQISGTVFNLSELIQVDSLDYLISRASKPIFLNNQEIFFLLFRHQLDSCDRFF